MLTTGILSLNVHDSLTYEGTELCLNPDLFIVEPGWNNRNRHSGSSGDDGHHKTFGSSNSANSGSNMSQYSTNTPLTVGDMVEIRVWDPLPKEAAVVASANRSLSSSSVLRKTITRQPPMAPSIQGGTSTAIGNALSFASADGSHPKSQLIAANTVPPSLRPRMAVYPGTSPESDKDVNNDSKDDGEAQDTQSVATASSKGSNRTPTSQPSILIENKRDSEKSLETGKEKSKTQDSQPPTSTVVASIPPPAPTAAPNSTTPQPQQTLPPVFPRTRTGTVDLNPSATATATGTLSAASTPKLTRPSIIHRRVVSSAGAIPTPIRSPKQQGPHSTRHVRDISDVTVDTHQLDIPSAMMLHQAESQETIMPMIAPQEDNMANSVNDGLLASISSTHRLRLSFVLKVTEKTLTSFNNNSRTQISMLRQVADLYNLSTYDLVTVHKIEPRDEQEVLKAVSADFVVVTIKDQFISRGDMLLFQTKLVGSWIYEGQRLIEHTRGIKAHAREIRHGNYSAKSGIVTDKTMITFRSRSARITWLVQLSSEMWDYASPYEHQYEPESVCEIYFDQWIRFLYKLFTKWKELEVMHSLTVIFFSRTFLTNGQKSRLDTQDVYGREFEDHYKPIIESETCVDWETLIVKIKEEFIKYPLEVGWNLTDRRPSSASQGNLLEAINVTLNLMQYHYLDRDLHRTGQSIVIVSPGCGVFEVDKGLASITYQRMMDNGIGSDMLSLGLPPLHIAPFFLYNNEYRVAEAQGIDTSGKYYEVPHWMHLSFVTYDRPEEKRTYLSGLEDKKPPVRNNLWLDGFEIGVNGFLRPQNLQQIEATAASGTQSPTSSFSLAGNKAATPGKAKTVQEQGQARQLISGRNFRDILEASRPRKLGASLPSALDSLISLRQFAVENKLAKKNGTKLPGKKKFSEQDVRLREWGTVEFGEFMSLQAMSMSSRSPSPSTSILKMAGINHSMIKAERSQNRDEISPSSSFGSSPVSSAYGISFDRVFWDYYDSPKTPGRSLQIQRSPSFELLVSIDGIPGTNNDDSIAASDKSSVGDESDTNVSMKSKSDKHVEQLRKFMDRYNATVCSPQYQDEFSEIGDKTQWSDSMGLMGSGDPEIATTPRAGGKRFDSSLVPKDGRSQGGLGAALSQYTTAAEKGLTTAEMGTGLMQRRSSGGHLLLSTQSRTTTSFNTERRRAASPMLNARYQFPDRQPTSPKLFSSTLSNLASSESIEYGRPDKSRNPAVLRTQPHRLSEGRETSSSSAFMPPPLFQSSGSMSYGMHSSSVSQLDTSRQRLLPISRSPPSNTASGDLSNKVVGKTWRAPARAYQAFPRSPPKMGMSRERSLPSESLAHSPPKGGPLQRERSGPPKTGSRSSPHGSLKGSLASRRKKAFNPFRQSDEDEVLAKRSHNRRRWSHVFPAGEVEFKRHAGPIWNSLTSPAILPLSVDYFPSPQELRDETRFQFNFYQVTLSGIENNHYATHADLLMEMVRQRVTQDFQIVTQAAVDESERRAFEAQREAWNSRTSRRHGPIPRAFPSIRPDAPGTTKHYLSMGHRIQVMNYNENSDTIEIIAYNRKSAQNDRENTCNYKFLLYSKVTEQYTKSIQTFKKYSEPYKWNRVDNLICGEEDRTMDVGMRFRRVMYGLIPEAFKSIEAEDEYVAKFKKLLAYLEKLREKDDAVPKLHVLFITSKNRSEEEKGDTMGNKSRRDMTDSMIRFSVQLLRGKKDPFEWIEIAIDPAFDTSASYRIIFNWLVASSAKVETQIQLLQRRCMQFGLKLISFPQTTVSWNLFLHALAAPTLLCIREKAKVAHVDSILKQLDFVYDGVTVTSPQFLDVIDDGERYSFARYRSGKVKSIPCPQFVHRSGALFIRKVTDRAGKAILVGIENYRHASKENMFRQITRKVVQELKEMIDHLDVPNVEKESST